MINNTIGNKRLAEIIFKSLQSANMGGQYGSTATTKECTKKHRLAYGRALTSAAWTILLTCMKSTNDISKIHYAGHLDIKGWHHKACEVITGGGVQRAFIARATTCYKKS